MVGYYKALHATPELSRQEEHTAADLARELRAAGFEVTEHVGRYTNPAFKGTGVVAVLRNGEHVSRQFWFAASLGTAALVAFALSRGGAEGGDLVADLLVVGAVLFSSTCYVLGAEVTRHMPGWQVISWVVVLALPITIPASLVIAWSTHASYDPTASEWAALFGLGISSMYLGFFAWYRGLAMAGTAYGGQVQQLQALLTLIWSAWWLGETVTVGTIATAVIVIVCVVWAQRSRGRSAPADTVAPEE